MKSKENHFPPHWYLRKVVTALQRVEYIEKNGSPVALACALDELSSDCVNFLMNNQVRALTKQEGALELAGEPRSPTPPSKVMSVLHEQKERLFSVYKKIGEGQRRIIYADLLRGMSAQTATDLSDAVRQIHHTCQDALKDLPHTRVAISR